MDKLIEFTIREWPGLVSLFVLVALTLGTLCIPAIFWLLYSKILNKERYIFANSDHLYRLDTVTGKIHMARGLWFQEVEITGPHKSSSSSNDKKS